MRGLRLVFFTHQVAPACFLILPVGTQSQIAFAVIKAVMVLVVANHTLGCTHNLSMHINGSTTFASIGIKCGPTFGCVPFVLVQPVVIVRVNYCKPALG